MTDSGKPIEINCRRALGRPCIAGTGRPTFAVVDLFKAGDSIEVIARDYELSEQQVTDAIRFELLTPGRKLKMLDIADAGPVENFGAMWELNLKTLRWTEVAAATCANRIK